MTSIYPVCIICEDVISKPESARFKLLDEDDSSVTAIHLCERCNTLLELLGGEMDGSTD